MLIFFSYVLEINFFSNPILKLLFPIRIAEFPHVPFKSREEIRHEAALCWAAQWVV